jgi:hypothetical protein
MATAGGHNGASDAPRYRPPYWFSIKRNQTIKPARRASRQGAPRAFLPATECTSALSLRLCRKALLRSVGRPCFLEQVAERLVREFLKIHHPIARKHIERLPRLVLELNTLAAHPCGTRALYLAPSDTPTLIAFWCVAPTLRLSFRAIAVVFVPSRASVFNVFTSSLVHERSFTFFAAIDSLQSNQYLQSQRNESGALSSAGKRCALYQVRVRLRAAGKRSGCNRTSSSPVQHQ